MLHLHRVLRESAPLEPGWFQAAELLASGRDVLMDGLLSATALAELDAALKKLEKENAAAAAVSARKRCARCSQTSPVWSSGFAAGLCRPRFRGLSIYAALTSDSLRRARSHRKAFSPASIV